MGASRKPRARSSSRSQQSSGARTPVRKGSSSNPFGVAKLGLYGMATMFAFAALVGSALSAWSYFAHSSNTEPKAFDVAATESSSQIAARLASDGLVGSSWLMDVYLSTLGRTGKAIPGAHFLPAKSTPRTLSQCLSRAPGRPTVEVVFPEGFDHVRTAQRLQQRGVCGSSEFVLAVRSQPLLKQLAISGPDAEGYLFPAAYRLFVDSEPAELINRFVLETRSRLRKLDEQLGGGALEALSLSRGWGEREVLTLASMVEKEAKADDERPIIASVFYNRLDSATFRPKRMLQSDPTAGYGCLVLSDVIPSCRDYRQRITAAMLRDASNPYNTYRHAGLPPGPIASPGEVSIAGVLKPASTDFLFFVASGDGRHRFSRTLEEHEANIRSDGIP